MPIGQSKAKWQCKLPNLVANFANNANGTTCHLMTKFLTNPSCVTWWPTLQLIQVTKFATNASGVIWWSNLQLMQVVPSGGQICYKCKWRHVVAKFSPSHGVNFWVRCASGNVFWKHALQGKCVQIFEACLCSRLTCFSSSKQAQGCATDQMLHVAALPLMILDPNPISVLKQVKLKLH